MPKRNNPRTGPKYEKTEAPARRGRTAQGAGRGSKAAEAYAPKKMPARPEENPNLLIGRNPVTEAIKAGRPVDKILIPFEDQRPRM